MLRIPRSTICRLTTRNIYGSPQESDKVPILCGFPHCDEFGLGRGHALNFEKKVAQVRVAAPPFQDGANVSVERFHDSEPNVHPVVAQQSFQVINEKKS